MVARPVRVLLVDDFMSFRNFTACLLVRDSGFEIVGEAADGGTAVLKARELRPELVVMDIGLPKLNGIEAARQIRSLSPAPEIIFLTANDSGAVACAALRTGAKGYVVKADAVTELMDAILTVLVGKQYVSKRLAGEALDPRSAGVNSAVKLPAGGLQLKAEKCQCLTVVADSRAGSSSA